MNSTIPSVDEVVERGKRLYEEQLKHSLEPTHNGKFAVININTGEYEIASSHLQARNQAAARWPGQQPFYGVRIGYPTVGRLGGRVRVKREFS